MRSASASTNVLRLYLDDYSRRGVVAGFERPLRTRAHFERAVGRKVRVKTETGRARGEVARGRRRAPCRSGTAPDAVDIPYDEIVRANLIDEGTKG